MQNMDKNAVVSEVQSRFSTRPLKLEYIMFQFPNFKTSQAWPDSSILDSQLMASCIFRYEIDKVSILELISSCLGFGIT